MANAEKGEVSFTAKGQRYTLALTLNVMVELEDLFGLTFDEVIVKVGRGSAKHIRGLLWATMQRYHKGITQEEVGELIDATNLGELQQALGVVDRGAPDPKDVKAVTPKGDKKNPTAARPVEAGTGASSISQLGG